ncbi:toxin TcdB middle/N-terminal domain-containing protein [Psychrosphaera algicola]|uniref:Toxin TcdB middle/N-terminal domain-containing protein n=1 Tax=Psychrosphaera algicola TaxID=3023714 RepID=A0ABT5FGS8_9GAMM|nr:toxin TcdB middle/N-terminal domain-containing protein [Psychrosphaera sp. G1-22]MDC2890353.1 toxin TcdB middle/N-terminal domain-containing protein [Psychrosphaera sp. G1-22]
MTSTTTKYDLLLATGDDTAPTLTLESNLGGATMNTVRFGDLNGDFITDITYVKGTDWYYRLGNGIGFSPEKPMGLVTDSTKKLLNRFVDLNGDGRTDVLHATASNKWAIYFSRPTENIEDIDFEHRGYQSFDSNPENMQFADVAGDGNLELLTATSSTWKKQFQSNSGQYNTINEIVNGFGVSTHIRYKPLTQNDVYFGKVSDNLIDTATFSPRRGNLVVRFVGERGDFYDNPYSPTPGRAAIYYEYAGLLIHKEGLGSLGFQAIKTFDYLTKIETTTEYNQDYGASSYVLRGMPIQTNSKKGEVTLSSATNTLAVKNSENGVFGVIENLVEKSYQYNSNGTSTALSEVDSTFGYSSWGNLTTSEIVTTDLTTSGTSLTTSTVNEYGTSNEYKRLARLTNTTVTKTRKNEGVTLPTVTRESSFTYNSDLMLETTTRSPTDSQNKQVTTYDYDEYGNKISTIIVANVKDTTSSQTRKATTEYGPKGRYVKYKKTH